MTYLPKPPICPTCDGQRVVIVKVRCTLYRCGTQSVAMKCPACVGTGKLLPVVDAKTLATGDAA